MNFNYNHKKKPETGDFEIVITGDSEAWKMVDGFLKVLVGAISETVKELLGEIKSKIN